MLPAPSVVRLSVGWFGVLQASVRDSVAVRAARRARLVPADGERAASAARGVDRGCVPAGLRGRAAQAARAAAARRAGAALAARGAVRAAARRAALARAAHDGAG